ncbi:hypothetical protein ThidrDRAFT_1347 [Thiorhodococcus drewsii AZ1]|uniref:Lipoprotein n=1 Tax=Thiorhodococcus drewsii AZ1 TaxID=765913 RepID=G2DYY8_9GAMM|nr:hypothetical protein [Thiorhodococcus drewsii]EGV32497.1 hypothetical protein ThidrDRAFT_1347 [Thiorhodococcus drewsii AZ1]
MLRSTATFLVSLSLAGCLLTTTKNSAPVNLPQAQKLSSLEDFGDQGGMLIIGVVDKGWFGNVRVPNVRKVVDKEETRLKVGDFVERSITGKRITPELELGALYYIPEAYNSPNTSAKIIQKLCATVDGHNLDDVLIADEPSGITSERRKLVLDGSLDVEFLKFVGITARSGAKYLFELELKKPRKREIFVDDAEEMRRLIANGPICRKEYLPMVSTERVFQLVAAYYGELTIKQAYELEGVVGAPKLKAQLNIGSENERIQLVYFKIFPFPVTTLNSSGST